ncbi:hypothetical protein AB5I41_23695 [Sphingomonas sp. MMS24-JH45]
MGAYAERRAWRRRRGYPRQEWEGCPMPMPRPAGREAEVAGADGMEHP